MANESISIDPDPESALWLGIVFAVYAVIGIPANLLVLTLTVIKKDVRAIPSNICIFSLAFTDLMFLASGLSSILWALTYNTIVCKVMGLGIYVFLIMSMTLPSCLALCRHAGLCSELELHPILRPLKTRKGVLVLNGAYWTYGLLFMLPFIIADKFGMDEMGCCGLVEIDSIYLRAYYYLAICGVMIVAYAVTLTYYRKLVGSMEEMRAQITPTSHTNATITLTRNLTRMIKWLLFVPVVFFYPGFICQMALRFQPGIVSLKTARLFMIAVPLPHVIDPFITLLFVRCYRRTMVRVFLRNGLFSNTVHPNEEARSAAAPMIRSEVRRSLVLRSVDAQKND